MTKNKEEKMEREVRSKKEKLIFCENVRYLVRKYNLSRTAIMGVSMKTLKSIENDVIPRRMSCEVFVRIYVNFDIGSQYMLFPVWKKGARRRKC